MKKLIIIVLALSLVAISAPTYAAKGRKGASDMAMEKASDKAVFHRASDWFATIGKSDEEKAKIIAERDAKRAAMRAKKEAEKAAKKAEKETTKAKEQVQQKVKKSKKETEQAQEKVNTRLKSMKGIGKTK